RKARLGLDPSPRRLAPGRIRARRDRLLRRGLALPGRADGTRMPRSRGLPARDRAPRTPRARIRAARARGPARRARAPARRLVARHVAPLRARPSAAAPPAALA